MKGAWSFETDKHLYPQNCHQIGPTKKAETSSTGYENPKIQKELSCNPPPRPTPAALKNVQQENDHLLEEAVRLREQLLQQGRKPPLFGVEIEDLVCARGGARGAVPLCLWYHLRVGGVCYGGPLISVWFCIPPGVLAHLTSPPFLPAESFWHKMPNNW